MSAANTKHLECLIGNVWNGLTELSVAVCVPERPSAVCCDARCCCGTTQGCAL